MYLALILYNYVSFQIRTSLKGNNLGNNFYHKSLTPLSVTNFITHIRILRHGSYANDSVPNM